MPSDIASDPLLTEFDSFEDNLLTSIEDNRLFHPEQPWNPPAELPGLPARIRTDRSRFSSVPQEAFAVPHRTAVCIRRKTRREVIFAKRRNGRGGRSRRHFNFNSWVKC